MNNGASASAYAATFYVTSALAILMNVVLFILYARCPLKTVKTYKYFFTVTAAHDIAISMCLILCLPRTHHGETYLVQVSVGLLHQWQSGGVLLMLLWSTLSSSMLILANSFIYRYICICRNDLSYLYMSWRWTLLICIVNLILLVNTSCMLPISLLPNEAFKEQIYAEFPEIDSNAFAGVSLLHSFDKLSSFLCAEFFSILLSLCCIEFYCAIRIHLHLKQCGLSSNVKRLQRQMFSVLMFQTACPTLLLCFPLSVSQMILFGGVHTSHFPIH